MSVLSSFFHLPADYLPCDRQSAATIQTAMTDRIYVAATSQHVGKTTSTLGLVEALRERRHSVGYCKPVGQQFVDLGDLKVDKDALLFSKVMGFELKAEIHSPVIVGAGVTREYLDDPARFDFADRILEASNVLQQDYEIVVYEGTGHPGVGSVCDMSNADVAKLLGAPVVMIVEGGIGNTIDRLNMSVALFREQKVPIMGVIINKVIPEKLEQVKYYVGKKLLQMGIPLLGVLPYDQTLSNPIMEGVRIAVNGVVLMNGHRLDNRVENVASGSLMDKQEFSQLRNLLIIVSYRRLESVIHALEELEHKNDQCVSLAGIILNGENEYITDIQHNLPGREYLDKNEIPVIATQLDTYGSAIKISRMEVKINTRTPWKASRAVELIRDHVNLDAVL